MEEEVSNLREIETKLTRTNEKYYGKAEEKHGRKGDQRYGN